MRFFSYNWFGSLNEIEQEEEEKSKIIFKKIREDLFTLLEILRIFRVDLWNQCCYEALNTFNKLFKYACKLCPLMQSFPLLL